jgi:hypothetical protein
MRARSECARCGCCCFSAEPGYIRLYAVDLERLGERVPELTAAWGEGRAMRFEAGRCVALRYDEAAGCFSCAIHAERPDACRWLTPGSGTCRHDREGHTAQAAAWAASLRDDETAVSRQPGCG